MANSPVIVPQPGLPIVLPQTGMMTDLFFRFLIALWQRTGSGSGVDTGSLSGQVATVVLGLNTTNTQISSINTQIVSLNTQISTINTTLAPIPGRLTTDEAAITALQAAADSAAYLAMAYA